MNIEWILLRIFHVGCGTFWVGSDAFMTFLLVPRLRALGPRIERPVMADLMRRLPPVMTIASLVTVVSGIWMTVEMQGWSLGWITANGWGLAIGTGLIGSLVALVIGLAMIPPVVMRHERLYRSVENREPTAEENAELQRLTARATRLVHINSVLLIIVVLAMAVARWV